MTYLPECLVLFGAVLALCAWALRRHGRATTPAPQPRPSEVRYVDPAYLARLLGAPPRVDAPRVVEVTELGPKRPRRG